MGGLDPPPWIESYLYRWGLLVVFEHLLDIRVELEKKTYLRFRPNLVKLLGYYQRIPRKNFSSLGRGGGELEVSKGHLFLKKYYLKYASKNYLREVNLDQNSWIVLHYSAANLENNLGHQIVKICHEKEQYFQLLLNNEIDSTAMQNYPTILA